MRVLLIVPILLTFHLSFTQDLQYQGLLLDKSLTKNANAVVRLDEMTVALTSMKEMNIRLKRVVTILNKHGNRHAHTQVGYNNSIKVKHLQATIYDFLGNEIEKIKRKDFKDISAVTGGTLYSDSRVLYMEYTPVQYPYTVEFTYEITTENTGNIPNWYFLDGFLVSMEKSRYTVKFNSDLQKPLFMEKNLEGISVIKNETGNSVTYEAENILAIKQESLSPSFTKIAPMLMVRVDNFSHEGYDAQMKNWKEMGQWMHKNLLSGRDELPEATRAKARSLVRDVKDDLEKAKIIYKYVQDNTRYISVQVGIGGLQPIEAIDVDRVKYGDCKGLSNYTKALLETVGVKAYYTHVESGRDKVDFEEEFADLAQGDHVILAIPYKENYYWIDCTSQTQPFGFLGDFTDDRRVLVIKPEGGELARTPSYLNEDNYQKTEAQYTLDAEGAIKGSVAIATRGIQYDDRYYLEEKTRQDLDERYKEYWHYVNNLSIESLDFENNKEDIRFLEKVSVEAANYASKSGDRLLFKPNAFNRNLHVPDRYRNRKLPFEIQRGYLDEDEFTIQLPKGYVIEGMAPDTKLDTEFGQYGLSMEYNEVDHSITYRRSLLLKAGDYGKEKYAEYRSFRRKIAAMDNVQIAIIKTM